MRELSRRLAEIPKTKDPALLEEARGIITRHESAVEHSRIEEIPSSAPKGIVLLEGRGRETIPDPGFDPARSLQAHRRVPWIPAVEGSGLAKDSCVHAGHSPLACRADPFVH